MKNWIYQKPMLSEDDQGFPYWNGMSQIRQSMYLPGKSFRPWGHPCSCATLHLILTYVPTLSMLHEPNVLLSFKIFYSWKVECESGLSVFQNKLQIELPFMYDKIDERTVRLYVSCHSSIHYLRFVIPFLQHADKIPPNDTYFIFELGSQNLRALFCTKEL